MSLILNASPNLVHRHRQYKYSKCLVCHLPGEHTISNGYIHFEGTDIFEETLHIKKFIQFASAYSRFSQVNGFVIPFISINKYNARTWMSANTAVIEVYVANDCQFSNDLNDWTDQNTNSKTAACYHRKYINSQNV